MNCLTVSCHVFEAGCKVDWPAWVQAIGSVLAIIAAIVVAWFQARSTRKEIERQNKALMYSQAQFGEYFVKTIVRFFDEAYRIGERHDPHAMRILNLKMDDFLNWTKSFSIDTYSHEKLDQYIRIQQKAFELVIYTLNVSFSGNSVSMHVKSLIKDIEKDIHKFHVETPDWALLE